MAQIVVQTTKATKVSPCSQGCLQSPSRVPRKGRSVLRVEGGQERPEAGRAECRVQGGADQLASTRRGESRVKGRTQIFSMAASSVLKYTHIEKLLPGKPDVFSVIADGSLQGFLPAASELMWELFI